MTNDLFRSEVLQARRSGWLGSISLAQPVRFWILTVAAVLIALTVVLFIVFGSYTRRSSVTGQLVPSQGLATVLSPATGVVTELDFPEGSRVAQGDVLALVSVPRATASSGNTQAALEHRLDQRQDGLQLAHDAQDGQLLVQSQGIRNQLSAAQRELQQVETETATRQQQIRIASETLERLRRLEDSQFVSILQIKQQEALVLDYTSQMQSLQRQAISTRRLIAQLEQSLLELPSQRAASSASYQRELAALEQERVQTQANGSLVITAPVDGVVATQVVKSGQAVQATQPLLSLLPGDGKLEAELLVPSRAIGFIAPGDLVLLRYQAFPYQKFGHQKGKVSRISRSALTPAELGALVGSAEKSEPFYRVTVALSQQAITAYGKQETLKPGMLLEADVMGEKRKLIEWIFEPLYSISGKVWDS